MSAGVMLRQKIAFDFVTDAQVLTVNRDDLAKSGLVVANVTARAIDPLPQSLPGIVVRLDDGVLAVTGGPAGAPDVRGGCGAARSAPAVRRGRRCRTRRAGDAGGRCGGRGGGRGAAPRRPGRPIARRSKIPSRIRCGPALRTTTSTRWKSCSAWATTRSRPTAACCSPRTRTRRARVGGPNSFIVFNWVIDAHPEDINKIDFKRPGRHAGDAHDRRLPPAERRAVPRRHSTRAASSSGPTSRTGCSST